METDKLTEKLTTTIKDNYFAPVLVRLVDIARRSDEKLADLLNEALVYAAREGL